MIRQNVNGLAFNKQKEVESGDSRANHGQGFPNGLEETWEKELLKALHVTNTEEPGAEMSWSGGDRSVRWVRCLALPFCFMSPLGEVLAVSKP